MSCSELEQLINESKTDTIYSALRDEYNKASNSYFKLLHQLEILVQYYMEKYEQGKLYLPEYTNAIFTYENIYDRLIENKMPVQIRDIFVIAGTAMNDLHDLGIRLLIASMKVYGIQVCNLGVSVELYKYINVIFQKRVDVIAISAMLLNTRPYVSAIINDLTKMNIRKNIKVFVGGAAMDEAYAKAMRADFYSPNVVTSTKKVVTMYKEREVRYGTID